MTTGEQHVRDAIAYQEKKAAALVAAELDPTHAQLLADRMRRLLPPADAATDDQETP